MPPHTSSCWAAAADIPLIPSLPPTGASQQLLTALIVEGYTARTLAKTTDTLLQMQTAAGNMRLPV